MPQFKSGWCLQTVCKFCDKLIGLAHSSFKFVNMHIAHETLFCPTLWLTVQVGVTRRFVSSLQVATFVRGKVGSLARSGSWHNC